MRQQGSHLDETTVRRYLLDELPADEREQLEMRLLTDDDFFARLLGLEETQEDELIEQYVNEELSGREREKFLQVFLTTPERREKLNLVKDLSAYAAAPVQPAQSTAERKKKTGGWFPSFLAFFSFRSPLLGASLASALALAVLGGAWLFFKVRGLESEVSRLKSGQASAPAPAPGVERQLEELRARNDELAAALRRAEEERDLFGREVASLKSQATRQPERPATPPAPQRGPILSLVLPLIQGRSNDTGGARELKLPAGPARVELRLDLDVIDPREFRNYRALVKKRDGKVAWEDNRPRLQSRGGENHLVVSLPAERLPEGEYIVELSGISGGVRDVIGVYTFRSSKQ